jgi:cytochrome c oxidase assembly protein subunit 15
VAVLLVCATFPLIWVGGLVTTYEAGMAVPDWPSTYGYNLFLYPWQTWIFGPFDIFIEHGHRLLGATVGLIAIALVLVTWWCEWRNWVKSLAAITLGAVIVQGVLGGLRVVGNDVELAKIHGIFGPTFFAICVAMAVVTSRLWRDAAKTAPHPQGGKLQRLAIITAALVLLQIAVGAHLRHLPVDFTPEMFRMAVFFHLLLAAALVVHIVLLVVRIVRKHRDVPALVRPALALVVLIGLQLALGSATWVIHYAWPSWMQGFAFTANLTLSAGGYWQAMVVTAHQATGSLILAFAVLLALRSVRLVPQLRRSALTNVKLTGVLA